MNRYLGPALIFTTVALCLAEISARTYLGLGDPPLTIRDSSIEYMFAPSRCYRRFGNSVCYNQWSMRSDDFASIKTNSLEKRVLVMGDSVINGGALTDQKDLATTLLQQRLSDCLQVPVVVGNVSAGSWGPGNILAYTRRYGWFDADLVFIVLNTGDLHDVPTFSDDLGPDFPTKTPVLAFQEAIYRYLPRYLNIKSVPLFADKKTVAETIGDLYSGWSTNWMSGPIALRKLLTDAARSVPNVIILLHPTQAELAGGFGPEADQIEVIATGAGVQVVRMNDTLSGSADRAYRDADPMHINKIGQDIYARRMVDIAEEMLSRSDRL